MNSEVVNSLYEAFATFEKPKEISGCRGSGDLTLDESLSLLSVELAKTSPKLIEKLANNCAFVGGSESLQFFLPRIFDLILQDRIELRIPSLLFDVMKEVTLNTNQKEVLGRIFARVVEKICNGDIDDFILDWLRGAASLNLPLKPILEKLDQSSQKTAKQYFFATELGYNLPSSGVLSRAPEFVNWYKANIDQILDP